MKKILFIEDAPTWQEIIKNLFKFEKEYELIFFTDFNFVDLPDLINLKCQIIILDYNLPVLNGAEVLERLRSLGCSSRILFFSVFNDPHQIQMVFNMGANGYLNKRNYLELVKEVNLLLKDKSSLGFIQKLTFIEINLWKYVVEDLPNWRIGELLFVEESSIEYRLGKLSEKIGIPTKKSILIKIASEQGWWK